MDTNRLEADLIRHCAPTLAGLKSAGLFRYFYEDPETAKREIAWANSLLNSRGVAVEALVWKKEAVLIYAYRRVLLQETLLSEDVRVLLRDFGYECFLPEACIRHLKERLEEYDCFPHEIGVFLDYPIEDVQGFIKNRGKNCACCGIWKVYCDASEKEKLFCKLRKCTQIYAKRFSEGRSMLQMTVCV